VPGDAQVVGPVSDPVVIPAGDPRLAPSTELSLARASVLGALAGTAAHESARARILEFLDQHPLALHRDDAEGHLTGSALVVDPSTRHLLVLFHAKVRRWLQPGGHADGDANLAAVALREAQEETGIDGLAVVVPAVDLDVHVFRSASGAEPDHLHLDVRHLVLAPPGAEAATNHESLGARWVTVEGLSELGCDPGTLRMARSGLALLDHLEDLGHVLGGWTA
jgi:8-oxo-dGTP pyrophosphatase MutT (NUDIX family)